MPRLSEAAMFDRTISQLITKRRTYSQGLAQIDAILAKYNIQIGNGSTPASRPRTPEPLQRSRQRPGPFVVVVDAASSHKQPMSSC